MFSGGSGSGSRSETAETKSRCSLSTSYLRCPAVTPEAFPSPTHPPLPLPTGCYRLADCGGRAIAQVAPPATWMHLLPDPQGGGRQEAHRQPSDPLWWPFLSPRCLTGRKDAVCCPPAPLTCSPLLVPTRENTLLIPDSSLALPCSFVLLPPLPPTSEILLFVPCRPPASSFSSPCCQHPLRPIPTSLLFSLRFSFFWWRRE